MKMESKYKELYDFVNSLGYSPSYITNRNGLLTLRVYPDDKKVIGEYIVFQQYSIESMKKAIKETYDLYTN